MGLLATARESYAEICSNPSWISAAVLHKRSKASAGHVQAVARRKGKGGGCFFYSSGSDEVIQHYLTTINSRLEGEEGMKHEDQLLSSIRCHHSATSPRESMQDLFDQILSAPPAIWCVCPHPQYVIFSTGKCSTCQAASHFKCLFTCKQEGYQRS